MNETQKEVIYVFQANRKADLSYLESLKKVLVDIYEKNKIIDLFVMCKKCVSNYLEAIWRFFNQIMIAF